MINQPTSTSTSAAPSKGLTGLRVLSLESRRAAEMAKLIANYGGDPIVAPSMQEVPLSSNTEALTFARNLVEDGFEVVIFLTGVGTRMLARVAETLYPRDIFVAALRRAAIVARGPKPVAALAELGVPITLAVPEPNTWKDLLRALDERSAAIPLAGKRVAIQEYGAANEDLLAALAERGAQVTRVPVYEWALPDDTAPLRAAAASLARGEIDVALFTTATQFIHLLHMAAEMNIEPELLRAFARTAVGSIGPVTSQVLREHGLPVDFEPTHPKMGFLVAEAATRAAAILGHKRAAK